MRKCCCVFSNLYPIKSTFRIERPTPLGIQNGINFKHIIRLGTLLCKELHKMKRRIVDQKYFAYPVIIKELCRGCPNQINEHPTGEIKSLFVYNEILSLPNTTIESSGDMASRINP